MRFEEGLGNNRPVSTRLAFVCCGVRIDALALDAAVACLERLACAGKSRVVHLCNANNLALALRDAEYRRLLNEGDLNLPDGAPLVLLAKHVGARDLDQQHRPRGVDVFLRSIERSQHSGVRHYLYGSDQSTLEALAQRLRATYPSAPIVGTESPPFRPLTEEEKQAVVDRLRSSRAQIVWVALGTPRQDEFLGELRDRVDAVLVAVGAAFDFAAGAKPEAPVWLQRHGLEWFFRLGTEPRRLWKRYVVGNVLFLACLRRGVTVLDGDENGGRKSRWVSWRELLSALADGRPVA